MSIEAMKQALAKFEHLWEIGIDVEYKVELLPEIRILRQAIEQAEKQTHTDHPMRHWDRTCPACVAEAEKQEPVAWMVSTQDDKKLMLWGEEKPPIFNTPVKLIPLYIAPSKREWVRLTDEEIEGIAKRLVADASYCSLHFAVAIQGAFMRKNI